MPEVSGDAALLVNPYKPDDIAEAMFKIWKSPGLAVDLRERGFVNARRFSWDQTARETLAVYREAVDD